MMPMNASASGRTQRTMPVLLALLVLWSAFASAFHVSPARAETPALSMTLVSQSTWNTPSDPAFDSKVAIRNDGTEQASDLVVQVTLYDALPNRGSYQHSLTQTPEVAALRPPIDIPVDPIDPGQETTVRYQNKLGFLAATSAEGRIYPITMTLVQAGQQISTLRTAAIFIPQTPKVPLQLGWTFVLSFPTVYDPVDDVFVDRSLERAIAPDGWLGGEIAALHEEAMRTDATALDIAVSASLLQQLTRMQDGYAVLGAGAEPDDVPAGAGGAADAASALAQLREMMQQPGTKLSALPFAEPNLPRLSSSGLGADIAPQIELGRATVSHLLGAPVDPRVLVPPGSALDERTPTRLLQSGVTVVPVAPGTIEQPAQDRGFAPPPVAQLPAGDRTLTAVVPDAQTADLIDPDLIATDPRLAAQHVIGDLAAVWLEDPARERGIAFMLAQEHGLDPHFVGSLLRLTAPAPFVRPTPIGVLASRFAPTDGHPKIAWSHPQPIPAGYLSQIQRNRDVVDAYRSAATTEVQRVHADALETQILQSEQNSLVNDPLGLRWLAAPYDEVNAIFASVHADPEQVFTLTAREGTIPVRITNTSGEELAVRVKLASTRVRFTGPNPQRITIGADPVPLSFPVAAQTTGRFPIQVIVLTPNGRVMGTTTIIVRSTAYSRVALIIMAAAGLALIGMWAKRLRATRRARKQQLESA